MGEKFNSTILHRIRDQFNNFTEHQAMKELDRQLSEAKIELGITKSEMAEIKDEQRKRENKIISLKAESRSRGEYIQILKQTLKKHGHSVPTAP